MECENIKEISKTVYRIAYFVRSKPVGRREMRHKFSNQPIAVSSQHVSSQPKKKGIEA
jgi:hypothetical protein